MIIVVIVTDLRTYLSTYSIQRRYITELLLFMYLAFYLILFRFLIVLKYNGAVLAVQFRVFLVYLQYNENKNSTLNFVTSYHIPRGMVIFLNQAKTQAPQSISRTGTFIGEGFQHKSPSQRYRHAFAIILDNSHLVYVPKRTILLRQRCHFYSITN